ncbi:MAG: hypothetical protein M5U19_06070 [Microthrixaceae bacterium]|nr:hypothetical protein [Microthrixaceae bacterium]
MAPSLAAELVIGRSPGDAADADHDGDRPLVDMLTVVRGSIFSAGATRPDGHTPEGFNAEVCRDVADAVHDATQGRTVVVAQGSIVECAMAEQLVAGSRIGAVEMTALRSPMPAWSPSCVQGRRSGSGPACCATSCARCATTATRS